MLTSGSDRRALRWYLVAWWVFGAVALAAGVLATVLAPAEAPVVRIWAFLAVVALAFLTDVGPFQAPLRRASVSINLYEVGLLVGLVLLPPLLVPAAMTLGVALSLWSVHRITPDKLAFNAAMVAGAATASAVLVTLLGPVPPSPTEPRGVAVLLAAGVTFGVTNLVALLGLVRLLAPREGPAATDRDYLTSSLFGLTISVSLGLILANAVATSPLLLPFFALVGWLTARGLAERMRRLTTDATQHARMERTIAGASDGICLLDARGQVELLNPAAGRLLRVEPSEATGRALDDLLARALGEDAGADVTSRLRSCTPERPFEDLTIDVGDATWRLELTTLFEREDRHHTVPTGAVVVLWDVTEEATAASARREFVARVSHELRTPLTAIVGFAETLRLRLDHLDSSRQREFLTVIERQGARLSRLVDDLLWSARAEAGTITTSPEPVLLRRLAPDITAGVHHLLGDTRLEWSVGDTVAYVDRGHLEQVLLNLLANASAYGAPPFRIAARTLDDRVIIEVSDAGAGVPAAFVPHLFDPFAQASTGDRRESRGLGLGLAIVSSLLASNGGTITYDRRDARSVFVLTLPAG